MLQRIGWREAFLRGPTSAADCDSRDAATTGQDGAAKCLLPSRTPAYTCRGRLQGRHLSKNPHAGPVKCNALLAGTPERRRTVSPSSSALRSVLNVNQTVAEPAFIEKFELYADLAWQIGIAAARDDRRDETVTFVDQ